MIEMSIIITDRRRFQTELRWVMFQHIAVQPTTCRSPNCNRCLDGRSTGWPFSSRRTSQHITRPAHSSFYLHTADILVFFFLLYLREDSNSSIGTKPLWKNPQSISCRHRRNRRIPKPVLLAFLETVTGRNTLPLPPIQSSTNWKPSPSRWIKISCHVLLQTPFLKRDSLGTTTARISHLVLYNSHVEGHIVIAVVAKTGK